MRSFASDNNSGVHPLVMDALLKANVDHAVGYGDDSWTHAAEKKLKEVFGEKATPFFVFNGTGQIRSPYKQLQDLLIRSFVLKPHISTWTNAEHRDG